MDAASLLAAQARLSADASRDDRSEPTSPARVNWIVVLADTLTLRAGDVGFITVGSTPMRVVAARSPEIPACATPE